MTEFTAKLEALLKAVPEVSLDYYAITLGVDEDGRPWHSTHTYWVRYTEDIPLREIRAARIVDAELIVHAWRASGQSAMVVNASDEMLLWFAFGGNAVVERDLAESVLANWLKPFVCVIRGEAEYSALGLVPKGALARAPTPKRRMHVLQRDKYRCRVCGRSPNDHVDLELHVHHIRPWARGGLTEDDNLITLCHTCHNGLDPHYESSLFRVLSKVSGKSIANEYWRMVRRHQDTTKRAAFEGAG
jgi:hypothetical protein